LVSALNGSHASDNGLGFVTATATSFRSQGEGAPTPLADGKAARAIGDSVPVLVPRTCDSDCLGLRPGAVNVTSA